MRCQTIFYTATKLTEESTASDFRVEYGGISLTSHTATNLPQYTVSHYRGSNINIYCCDNLRSHLWLFFISSTITLL